MTAFRGPRNSNWRGGRTISPAGYVLLRAPEHPRAKNGYVFEHVLVVERALGHHFSSTADIHHRNEIKGDNWPENLVACESKSYHRLLHERLKAYRATGDPSARICRYCGAWAIPGDPGVSIYGRARRRLCHPACAREYNRAR